MANLIIYTGLCKKIRRVGEFKTWRISVLSPKGENKTGRIQSCIQLLEVICRFLEWEYKTLVQYLANRTSCDMQILHDRSRWEINNGKSKLIRLVANARMNNVFNFFSREFLFSKCFRSLTEALVDKCRE